LNNYTVEIIQQAKDLLCPVVKLYKNERSHQSIGFLTLNQVHEKNIKTE